MTADDVKRFMLLFRSNTRSFGNWDPTSKKSVTEKRQVSYSDFVGHFAGVMGIGGVPLRDDGTCYWGAIDIDNHGKDEDTDINEVEQKIHEAGYPLVPVRSKSGGVHLYLFLSEPVKSELIRRVLKMWADNLNVPGTDCLFPKHDKMNRDNESGELGLSNWINFPYFACDKSTVRYAVINGKRVDVEMFLEYAEGKRQANSDIQKWTNNDHSEAPPCLQSKFNDGFTPGERNTGIYQIAVYARKKERDVDAATSFANELSEQFMPDIRYAERQKTIKSALTKTYNYKCDEFKDVCDRQACRKRKYGVSESQYKDMQNKDSIPKFYEAIMWTGMEEPRWSVKACIPEGAEYEIKYLSTDELRKYDMFKRKMIEITPVFLPPMKQGDWEAIIGPVMSTKIIMPIPEDTSVVGVIKGKLHEFLGRANFTLEPTDTRNREPLLRGMPVYQDWKGSEVVMFRSKDFAKYLKDSKSDVGKDMWLKMIDAVGAKPERIRVGANFVSIWMVLAEGFKPNTPEGHDFTPEY